VFCVPSCTNARRISAAHEVHFRTDAAALGAGYRPCRHCTPVAVRDAS
jgi:methylphosphotriester-DNA--protein-cysteine methyltransferase